MDKIKVETLQKVCRDMRKDCLIMAKAAGNQGFHFGATLSIIEIVAVLYLEVMNIGKDLFQEESRDRFILSKGHGVPAIYAALKQMNIISEKDLETFKGNDTVLYGHPSQDKRLGIEFSSGSLGQGLSFGVGTSLALKRKKNTLSRTFVLLGDGECNEGAVWEAALAAAKYRLDNLTVIVDSNHLQYDGSTSDVMPMDSMVEIWKSFGWDAVSIDGHDIGQCFDALMKKTSKPLAVIADTVKGKGISFMENVPSWHYGVMTMEQEEQAWREVTQSEN